MTDQRPLSTMEDFTDEAQAYVLAEMGRYEAQIVSGARLRTRAERVLKEDVEAIVKGLVPNPRAETAKLVNDWAKRLLFLAVGLAIAQAKTVYAQQPVPQQDVTWLLIYAGIAIALAVFALVLDFLVPRLSK